MFRSSNSANQDLGIPRNAEPAEPSGAGTKPECLNLYQDQWQNWTQQYPIYHVPQPAEDSKTAEYAIVKRNVTSEDAGRTFSLHSIVIQSDLIKKVLGTVFEGYEGITTALERLEFEAPFRPFFHRWQNLCDARDHEKDVDTKQHLNLLWVILEEELRSTLATHKSLLANGVMTYGLLWTILDKPHVLCFTQIGGDERVMALTSFSVKDVNPSAPYAGTIRRDSREEEEAKGNVSTNNGKVCQLEREAFRV